MPDDETRALLQEIGSNPIVQAYLQEACDDMYSVLQSMSLDMCSRGGMISGHDGYRKYTYSQTMHFLMNLGTMENPTHAGSVRNCDIGSVLSDGNIRERCSMLMNMLCNDKKYFVMQWLLLRANSQAAVQTDSTVFEAANKVTGSEESTYQRGITPLPPSIDCAKLITYKSVLGICSVAAEECPDLDAMSKKDMRKVLCRIITCPRKSTRIARPLCMQKEYMLASKDALPSLSYREWSLLRQSNITVLHWHHPSWLARCRPSSASTESCTSVAVVSHAKPLPTGIYPQADHSIMLPWATGRMCWKVITDSSFFMHACRRAETVVAGPSGHAHALLTFMRIFKSFDLEKWTLICIVWLVGADHHSVFEVLVAASRHGLSFASEHTNSLDFTRKLLRSIAPR